MLSLLLLSERLTISDSLSSLCNRNWLSRITFKWCCASVHISLRLHRRMKRTHLLRSSLRYIQLLEG
jgi:hypothetical protein